MRRLLFLVVFLTAGIMATHAQDPLSVHPAPEITFEKTNHTFRAITARGPAHSVDFTFTNTGNAPLVVLRTEANCKCITTRFSKKPLAPGESGILTVVYTPKKNAVGKFSNTITVNTNTPMRTTIIFVQGEVQR
jgi:hypothetical protein